MLSNSASDDQTCRVLVQLNDLDADESPGQYTLVYVPTGDEQLPPVPLATTNLVVEKPPQPPAPPPLPSVVLSDWRETSAAREGEHVSLSLRFDVPVPDASAFVLLRNSQPVEAGGQIKCDDCSLTVTLNDVHESDSGAYTLVFASDPQAAPIASTNLRVKPTPPRVLSSTWTPTTLLDEGRSVELSICFDKKLNQANFRLHKDDHAPTSDNNYSINCCDCTVTVELPAGKEGRGASVADAGRYSLYMISEEEEEEQLVGCTELAVVEQLRVLESDWRSPLSVDEGVSVTFNLRLNQSLDAGRFRLRRGNDYADILDHVEVDGECHVTVKLGPLVPSDSGHYSLLASRTDEEALVTLASTELLVAEAAKAPSVLASDWQATTRVKQGEDVSLSLTLDKAPSASDTLVLLKDNKPITCARAAAALETSVQPDGTCQVVVKLADDNGVYSLAMRSNSGEKELLTPLATTELSVEETAPRLLSASEWQPTSRVKEGECVSLSLRFDRPLGGDDVSAFVLLKNSKPITNSPNVCIATSGDDRCVLNVTISEAATPADAALYSLVQGEEADTPLASTQLVVEEKVRVVASEWPETLTARHLENVRLSLTLNKPVCDVHNFVLCKNDSPVAIDSKKVAIESDAECHVTVRLNGVTQQPDSGSYSLFLLLLKDDEVEPRKMPLASTQLTVERQAKPSVVRSDWQPQTLAKHGESIALALCLDRPLDEASESIELRKDNKPVMSEAGGVDVTTQPDGTVRVLVKLADLEAAKDAGAYSLVLKRKDEAESELASTRLSVGKPKLSPLDADRWPAHSEAEHGASIELTVRFNQPVQGAMFALVRLDTNETLNTNKAKYTISVCSTDASVLRVSIGDLDWSRDTADYCLRCLCDDATFVVVASTHLTVHKPPVSLVGELATDKSEYVEDEPVRFSFALSRPLDSSALEKHVALLRNGSPCGDLKWTQLQDKVRFYYKFNYFNNLHIELKVAKCSFDNKKMRKIRKMLRFKEWDRCFFHTHKTFCF